MSQLYYYELQSNNKWIINEQPLLQVKKIFKSLKYETKMLTFWAKTKQQVDDHLWMLSFCQVCV